MKRTFGTAREAQTSPPGEQTSRQEDLRPPEGRPAAAGKAAPYASSSSPDEAVRQPWSSHRRPPHPAHENDRALAIMLGLAFLVGLAVWGGIALLLFG